MLRRAVAVPRVSSECEESTLAWRPRAFRSVLDGQGAHIDTIAATGMRYQTLGNRIAVWPRITTV